VTLLLARWMPSPLGPLLAVASPRAVVFLEFVDRRAMEAQVAALRARFGAPVLPAPAGRASAAGPEAAAARLLEQLGAELEAYFAGKRRAFSVPVGAPGTPFQQRVWEVLRAIPCGQTRSYLDVAKAIGRPTATRAVARANGENRIAILIPCHRVIGRDGTLTGYGGGLWRKESLLRLEGARL
jgi:AraC family transcriptional regulator of adaptative response/methylated-DNA-[protein]-cysteine methyltransferase